MNGKDLLDRIFSNKKREEILDILDSPYPAHFQRVYLVGFLKGAVGLTDSEVCCIIHDLHKWEDYDPETTEAQVRSVKQQTKTEAQMKKDYIRRGGGAPLSSPCSLNPPGKWIGKTEPTGFILHWKRSEKL